MNLFKRLYLKKGGVWFAIQVLSRELGYTKITGGNSLSENISLTHTGRKLLWDRDGLREHKGSSLDNL